MGMIDFTEACKRTSDVLAKLDDQQLSGTTPCEGLQLRDVVAHVGGLALAFTAAARKESGEYAETPPGTGGYHLDADWRTSYPAGLVGLSQAWQAPAAWQGMTRIAGLDLPGAVTGSVALTEVVIHGWDIARAAGLPYAVDPHTAEAVLAHVTQVAAEGPVEGLFGPAVPVADDAPVLDRIVALSGRDPAWRLR
jgi:uncharacterized protein (TIGR03086 family)